MSALLTALLPATFSALGGVYSVAGSAGSYASRWSERFSFPLVDISSLTGTTQWRLAIDDGALTYPSPPDSTGSTTLTTSHVLDVTNLAQGSTFTPRARLENQPASPISVGTCTFIDASPLVVQHTAHGLGVGDQIKFTTTGALPGPLVVGTVYYVRATSLLADSFTIATTEGGAGIAFTSGAGSGTHTLTLYKAVTAWINAFSGTFTTGAVLAAVPTFSSNPLHDIQVFPIDVNTVGVGWNNYPTQTADDFLGTYVIGRVFDPGASGSAGSGTQISGLENNAQLPTSGAFADGAEVDVVLYPATEYPVDGLDAFVATGGVAKLVAYPAPELWARGFGVIGTPNDVTPLAGVTTLQLTLGVMSAATWSYLGSGVADLFALAGGPAGVTITQPTLGLRLGVLGGAPTEEGIFAATVSCRALLGHTPHVATLDVLIAVTGRLCLGWLHTDPLAIDLQLCQRDRSVRNYSAGTGALQLVRGDTPTLTFVWRTGPVSASNFGAIVDPSAFKGIRLTIYPEDNLDAEPYWQADAALTGSVLTVTTIAGNKVVTIAQTIQSDALDRQFAALNLSAGAEPGSVSLAASAQVVYTDAAGIDVTLKAFPVTIVQDADY